MFIFLRRKGGARARRRGPRLEVLEDRTVLTLFTVSAVPDHVAAEQATASVTHSAGASPVAHASLAGEAAPAGQGLHHGAFYLGGVSDLLQIDTAPDAGQLLGDPISVDFAYSHTSTLQNYYDFPTGNTAFVQWHGFLDAGDASQPLFDGAFSTDYITSDEAHDEGVVQINMNVGDSVVVHVWSSGEAFAAEPHFRDRVAFSADFVVNDSASLAPPPGVGPALARAAESGNGLARGLAQVPPGLPNLLSGVPGAGDLLDRAVVAGLLPGPDGKQKPAGEASHTHPAGAALAEVSWDGVASDAPLAAGPTLAVKF
jgi:hypothetical protein